MILTTLSLTSKPESSFASRNQKLIGLALGASIPESPFLLSLNLNF